MDCLVDDGSYGVGRAVAAAASVCCAVDRHGVQIEDGCYGVWERSFHLGDLVEEFSDVGCGVFHVGWSFSWWWWATG